MQQTAVTFIEVEFNKLLLKTAFEKLSALEVDSLRTEIINKAKEMEKQQKVSFACDVYNEHYGKDSSFRSVAESMVNTDKDK